MTIVEFLRQRLNEDEAAARELTEHKWRPTGRNCQVAARHPDGSSRTIAWCDNGYDDDFGNSAHIARYDPARVLREVEAKRAIVDMHWPKPWPKPLGKGVDCAGCHEPIGHDGACTTLRLLTLPFADHPDYDTAWRP